MKTSDYEKLKALILQDFPAMSGNKRVKAILFVEDLFLDFLTENNFSFCITKKEEAGKPDVYFMYIDKEVEFVGVSRFEMFKFLIKKSKEKIK